MAYFESYISSRPDLELVEIYADRGLSGTTVHSRAAFAKLLADCEAGKIKLILTKEVSRFARNTVDALSVTRQLRTMGIGVLFLADGIDTRDGDGELRLAILHPLPRRNPAAHLSGLRWGQQRRMEAGVVFGNHCIFGYRVECGTLIPDPVQAPIVLEMFQRCAGGASTRVIAAWLNESGIRPLRAAKWSSGTVSQILRNEKYTGDLLQKKLLYARLSQPQEITQPRRQSHSCCCRPITRKSYHISSFKWCNQRCRQDAAAFQRKNYEKYTKSLENFGKIESGQIKSNVI